MKKIFTSVSVFLLLTIPSIALAQSGDFRDINTTLNTIGSLMSRAIPLIIGAAVLLFLWGILKFVMAGKDEERTEGRKFMVFGIIALAVMVSIWGLVNFVRTSVGIGGNNNVPNPPVIPGIRN